MRSKLGCLEVVISAISTKFGVEMVQRSVLLYIKKGSID